MTGERRREGDKRRGATTLRVTATILTAFALLLSSTRARAEEEPRLTGAASLTRLYRHILNADSDVLNDAFAKECVAAPREACQTLRVSALWWQIQLDPFDTVHDPEFQAAANSAIEQSEAWTGREPRRAEAWFYLGAAYAARVQWRVLREERLAAARDGKRIKDALERAIALDPELDDAYFGLGLYQYYADVAPAAAKFVRWLLSLPGGDRVTGLEQMLRARDRGELLQGEADYQLAMVYLWYEKNPGGALELLQGLQAAYPRNPVFLRMIAEVHDRYFHDSAASLESYRALLRAAQDGKVNAPSIAMVEARRGIARHLDAIYQTDRAIEELEVLVASRAATPFGAFAHAQYELGAAYDRVGRREDAIRAYRSAVQAAPPRGPFNTAERARAALKHQPNARAAEAYRLSLQGWRAFERQAFDEAQPLLTRSLELAPTDAVTHYRLGRLFHTRRQDAAAIAHYERAMSLRAGAPPSIIASTYLFTARLLERTGESARAISMYERAANAHGAAQDTRANATRALSRLRARADRTRAR